MMEEQKRVPSPCIGICALNEQDECIACGRTCLEIGEWGVMTNEQKRAVLQRIQDLTIKIG